MLPFRRNSLPAGWYAADGTSYPFGSDEAIALASLPETFKEDWGIVATDCGINVPDLFMDDAGCFLRAVNGTERQVGSKQGDAIRNIEGKWGGLVYGSLVGEYQHANGVCDFNWGPVYGRKGTWSSGSGVVQGFKIDASRTVPTADENRPKNIGMTPAIYLGPTNETHQIDYSFSEQYAGFRDESGRKIYMKSVDLGQLVNNSSKNIPHGILNIASLIMLDVIWESDNVKVHGVHANKNNSENFYIVGENIVVDIVDYDRSDFTGIARLKYTCTDR